MDTCSRLNEPGGVGWKHVNVARLRTTTRGKPLIWSHRVAARSDRWPRSLACAIRCCGAGWSSAGPAGADGGVAAPHNADNAAVGGPRGGDRSFAAGERAATHGARHFKKVHCDLCWSSEMRFRFIEDRRADYPVTICDVLGVSPAGYYAWSGRLGTLPSAEDVPSLAELARWSSPQPAEPIMATMRPKRNSAAATLSNYRLPAGGAFLPTACFPQHIHRIPTVPILGMPERSHGLAAQPFTGTKNPPTDGLIDNLIASRQQDRSVGETAIGRTQKRTREATPH